MSTAKILTTQQQRNSLKSKKSKKKETIRTVLSSPFLKYWPKISPTDAETLCENLVEQLPEIVSSKEKILWKDLKKIPKNERKPLKDIRKQNSNPELREGLIFGINDVIKSLEKNLIKSVLITDDVQPKFIVENLIAQCVLHQIPVLVLTKLRELLKNQCGIASITLGFTESGKYTNLRQIIKEIHKKYPVPRSHINFKRSLNNINNLDCSVISIEDSIMLNDSSMQIIEENPSSSSMDNFYLYRESTSKKRVFVPPQQNSEGKLAAETVDKNSEDLVEKRSIKQYQSLKVKKIKGNPNRLKRKIETVKNREKVKKLKKN